VKLIYCLECRDVVALKMQERTCLCGKSRGAYGTDGLHAWISGPVIPIGFANPSFREAIQNQPETGLGKDFCAFIIQQKCDTIQVIKTRPRKNNRIIVPQRLLLYHATPSGIAGLTNKITSETPKEPKWPN
jgi:hypothetical protein